MDLELQAAIEAEKNKPRPKKRPSIQISDWAKARYIYQHDLWQSGKVPNAVQDHGNTKFSVPKMDSNGLAAFMVRYVIYCGGNGNRVNVIGRKINGKWTPSATRKGTGDTTVTLPGGKSAKLEVKILNDKPSPDQIKEQARERAAGIYEFIKTPEQFFEWFDKETDNRFKPKTMFKVIIAGCRDFSDYKLLREKVSNILSLKQDVEIVSGRCDDYKKGVHTFTTSEGIKVYGADGLGEQYAFDNDLPVIPFPADWSFGKAAGPKRNKQMAIYADALIAFWDGKSPGTADMIKKAEKENLKVRVVRY